jgi:imidazolonepropionase
MGARDLKARAISHLEEVSDEGIQAMAESGTVAVILPTTAYILRLESPPVRKMIDANVIVALGTDFNPNAYCLSMVSFCQTSLSYVMTIQKRKKIPNQTKPLSIV